MVEPAVTPSHHWSGGAVGERSPWTPDAAARDLFSPVSTLMGNLRLDIPKPGGAEAMELEQGLGSPMTPGGATAAVLIARACPPTPLRPTHGLSRQDSLKDTKLLVATSSLRRVSQTSYTLLASGEPPPPPGAPGHFAFEGHFDFLRVIGTSPTSEVWLVRSRSDGALSAVKRSLAAFTGRADRQRYLREVQAAAALPEHPHVVRYYRGWQQERHFYQQMELCEGGSLAGVLRALPPGVHLPERDVWRLAKECADGLAHCHTHGVLHLDVKPANVFLDALACAKLGDFGNAVLAGRGWASEEGDGAYVAPELLRSDGGNASPAADVFSFGATLFETAAGAPLPRGCDVVPALPGRSKQLQALLEAMLQPVPEYRPSAFDVLMEACRVLGVPLDI